MPENGLAVQADALIVADLAQYAFYGSKAVRRLTNETRAGLADGVIKVLLSHPARLLGDTFVRAMPEAFSKHYLTNRIADFH